MLAVFLSAAVLCAAVLFLGQAVLRLAGADGWNWLAPAVGLSVAALLATPTMDIPGRAVTMAILLTLLAIAAAVWCLRSPPHRPPLADLAAALPVIALVIVPFLAAGRGGVLGVTVNNDMAVHLIFAEGYASSVVEAAYALPNDYPLGPHALAALLSEGLGIHAAYAFSGVTLALPVLSAWTALAVARRSPWYSKFVIATVVGLPYLIAAYYGQGSFKEVAQAALVLAVALSVAGFGPRLGRGRWVPLALLVGGIVSVYGPAGLLWPVAILGLWVAGRLAILVWRRRLSALPGRVRAELPALAVGLGVLVVVLLPQAARMWNFFANRDGATGIAVDNLGNLVGPLPWWEALGLWNSADYRLSASADFTGGKWSIFVLVLIAIGAVWAFRRGRWLLPLTALAAMAIWWLSDRGQSPYVTAKALVIASPLILLVAVLPLSERWTPGRWGRWPWLAAVGLGLVLLLAVGRDDLRTLRFSPVGPLGQEEQLQELRPLIAGQPTLYLGEDEFVDWQLAGVPTTAAALASLPVLPLREQKDWENGEPFDFDSVPASVLNEYEWIVSFRDPAGSQPPPQLRLVRSTEDYQLWKRTGTIAPRSILREGQWAGAVLDCETAAGRAIVAAGGIAAVRRPSLVRPLPAVRAGEGATVGLKLPAGTWDLGVPYISPYPIEVSAPGLRTTLPPTLSRPGPRLPIGRVTTLAGEVLPLHFEVGDTALAPPYAAASFGDLVITPAARHERIVPIAQACGRYVDWYRSAPS